MMIIFIFLLILIIILIYSTIYGAASYTIKTGLINEWKYFDKIYKLWYKKYDDGINKVRNILSNIYFQKIFFWEKMVN